MTPPGTKVDRRMITIGRLAAYAGVTIKAVRHYHRIGLLREPVRDSSGYRRYTADHAIALIKIKTLAEAGVPLARVKELLAADPQQFALAMAEIDRSLKKKAEELRRTRERIAHLSGGDRLFVSAKVADYLDRLRELGVSERTVLMERDGWILMQSVSPEQAARCMAEKLDAIDDPEFRAIYLEYDAAFGWAPDDRRLERLAARSHRWLSSRQGRGRQAKSESAPDPALVQLVGTIVGTSSPAWERLGEIARQQVRTVEQSTDGAPDHLRGRRR